MKNEIMAKIGFVSVFLTFLATAIFSPDHHVFFGLFLVAAAAVAVFLNRGSRHTASASVALASSAAILLAPLFLAPPAVFLVILVSAVGMFISLRKIVAIQHREGGTPLIDTKLPE